MNIVADDRHLSGSIFSGGGGDLVEPDQQLKHFMDWLQNVNWLICMNWLISPQTRM